MEKEWYKSYFQGITSDFWEGMASSDFTEKEGNFVLPLLELPSEAWVLDVPSGRGRMSLWLAQKQGIIAEGWDIDEENIRRLNEAAQAQKLPAIGIQADLVQVSPGREKYDGAVCLGNCFGYFDERGMDAFIGNVSMSLKKGAKWVIQTGMLAECIFPNWQDRDIYEVDGVLMEVENAYDPYAGRVEILTTFMRENQEPEARAFQHYVYTMKEVNFMMAMANLQIIGVYSNFQGDEFALGDEQVYIVVEKK